MPYISSEMRMKGKPPLSRLECLVDDIIETIKTYDQDDYEGVCNYTISRIVAGVMKPESGWRYKWLNRAHGTFLSAAAEFYRRVVGPYEDKVIKKNGDIPEYE